MLRFSWKRARLSLKHNLDHDLIEIKQAQIEIFKKIEVSGYLDLYYGVESHFGLLPNMPYSWQTKDNPIFLPAVKSKFLNVAGFMARKNNLFFEALQIIQLRLSASYTVSSHKQLKNYCDTG